MKKFILPALVAGLFTFTSCKKKEEVKPADAPVDNTTMTTEGTTTPTTAPTEVAAVDGMPTFSKPEVTAFATEYTTFMNDMKAAYVSQDAAKMKELGMKQQEWNKKTTEMAAKFSPEDVAKWKTYAAKLSTDLQTAMKTK